MTRQSINNKAMALNPDVVFVLIREIREREVAADLVMM